LVVGLYLNPQIRTAIVLFSIALDENEMKIQIEKKGLWIPLLASYSIRVPWILIEVATIMGGWWLTTLVVQNHIFVTTPGLMPEQVAGVSKMVATMLAATIMGGWWLRNEPPILARGWWWRVARWAIAVILRGLGRATLALARCTTPR
jgi:hypothetical protein